jgi:uncharacterized protein involved in exopolysaccharide biosynthesis
MGPELREYTQILWRRRWLVGLFFAGVVVSVGLFTFVQTPVYTAAATLLIEPSAPQVIDIQHVIAESRGYENSFYVTQNEMLRSRSLASRVVEEQHLAEEPAFLEGASSPVAALAGIALAPIHLVSSWLMPTREPSEEDFESWLVDQYLNFLGIHPVTDSRLIRLYYSSSDPVLAARVANAHARAYIAQGLELRTRANDEARRFLEGRLNELRSRLERAEAALNHYRREQGIVSLDSKENVLTSI